MKKLLCGLLLAWISYSSIAQTIIDPKPVVFKIRNFGVWTDGSFSGLKGEIKFDQLNPANTLFDVTVDANSVNTGIDLRDNHLRKEEYLDVKNYPEIKFISSKIVKRSNPDAWIVTGRLTIKKITKEISFPFLFEIKDGYNLYTGEFVINRRDFGVGGKSLSMADELTISLNVRK